MPNNLNMGFSPVGQALFGGGMAGMGGFGLGDQQETEEERKRRLAQLQQSRGLLTQNASPATSALGLGGSMFGGIGGRNGTGLI